MFVTVYTAEPVAARGFSASSGRAYFCIAITVFIVVTITMAGIAGGVARIEAVVFA